MLPILLSLPIRLIMFIIRSISQLVLLCLIFLSVLFYLIFLIIGYKDSSIPPNADPIDYTLSYMSYRPIG